MPEIHFRIQWPDGSEALCYSPSLVVKDYFQPQQRYGLDQFVTLASEALQIASDRVQAKYGMPCSLALGQRQQIQQAAQRFRDLPDPQVQVIEFVGPARGG